MNIEIYVIIATALQRTDLLLNRSLSSVYQQDRVDPTFIKVIIIDDNPFSASNKSDEFEKIIEGVKVLREKFYLNNTAFQTTILTNSGAKGNSGTGAWNTGLFHAFERNRTCFVSILDDDDEYLPNHLHDCIVEVKRNPGTKAVFQQLFWKNPDNSVIEFPLKKDYINPRAFFIGNPGIQGSNMFFKAEALVGISGFNEKYPNTTDRELMIRFLWSLEQNEKAENGIAIVVKKGIIHYNHNSPKVNNDVVMKQHGLDLFYQEYKTFFTAHDYSESIKRAKTFFKYQPIEER